MPEAITLQFVAHPQTWDGVRICWKPLTPAPAAYEVYIARRAPSPAEAERCQSRPVGGIVKQDVAIEQSSVIDNRTPRGDTSYYAVCARDADDIRRRVEFWAVDFDVARQMGHHATAFVAPDKTAELLSIAQKIIEDARETLDDLDKGIGANTKADARKVAERALRILPDFQPAMLLVRRLNKP